MSQTPNLKGLYKVRGLEHRLGGDDGDDGSFDNDDKYNRYDKVFHSTGDLFSCEMSNQFLRMASEY